MLPSALLALCTRAEGERIVPHYIGERDEPWLRALLDEYARFAGRKKSELDERLREPLSVRAPKAKLRMASFLLEKLAAERVHASVPPREARAAVFRARADAAVSREEVLARVADRLGVAPAILDASLFADLRGERRVGELPADLSPARLGLLANQLLVSSLLRRAARVRITAWGKTRALVRHARLFGLICVVSRPLGGVAREADCRTAFDRLEDPPDRGVTLEISGPFALFRRTEVYGRALASLLPRVAWCDRFELEAACALGRGQHLATLIVGPSDPILPGRELAPYDSKLEERFAKDFRRLAPDWDLIREPEPLAVEGSLVFPDFELCQRHDPQRRWLLEIVGFWTREYLTEKLHRLRSARIDRLVLCIDDRRDCGETELPPDAAIIRYKSRIDARAVLAIVAGGE